MTTSRLLCVPTLFLAATALGFGAPKTFEGKVRFLMSTDKTSVPMTYYMKGDLIRTEITADKGRTATMLLDLANRQMTILMPEQKMYMVHKLPDSPKTTPENAAQAAPVEVQHTGQYETILGYKCEKIIVKAKDAVSEIWGAQGMGQFMNPGPGGPMARRGPAPRNAWEAELASRGFFPLRVVTRDPKGNQTFKMEATEVDASTPADSLFVPPPDYKKFEMPALPGLGGLNPFNR